MPTKGSMVTVKVALIIVLSAGIVGLGAYKVVKDPNILKFLKGKPTSILPALTPARDLRGIWISALPGKGFQLSGQFTVQGSTTTAYEDGDIELIINEVKDNIAYGTIRYTNVCAWGFSIVPIIGKINVPKTCINDSGLADIAIGVQGSALNFGTIDQGGVVATMRGSFTTDLIHGNMFSAVMPYGELGGVFNLNRKR